MLPDISTMLRITKLDILFIITLFCAAVHSEKRRLVWIAHPDVAKFYKMILLEYKDNQSESSIIGLTKNEKVELCESDIILLATESTPKKILLSRGTSPIIDEAKDKPTTHKKEHSKERKQSTGIVMSDYPKKDVDSPSSGLDNKIFEVLKKLHALKDLKDRSRETRTQARIMFNLIQFSNIILEIESQKFTIKALPCHLGNDWSRFVVDGHMKNLHFLVEAGKNKQFFVTGLLELSLEVDQHGRKELEETYLNSLNPDDPSNLRSLCRLNRLKKFRLCSTAFVSWRKEIMSNWYYIPSREPPCKENVILHFTSANEEDNRIEIPTDLVECNVNAESSNFHFYLTADHSEKDVIYLVELNSSNQYSLETRFKNVSLLKKAMETVSSSEIMPEPEFTRSKTKGKTPITD